jgi:hypothetical protein
MIPPALMNMTATLQSQLLATRTVLRALPVAQPLPSLHPLAFSFPSRRLPPQRPPCRLSSPASSRTSSTDLRSLSER